MSKSGFIRVAAASPTLKVANTEYNADQIIACAEKAAENGAAVVLFPELAISSYTCADLFYQQQLYHKNLEGLKRVIDASKSINAVIITGFYLRLANSLYNCAAVVCHGALLGLVPKTHLPNYAEFYELRHFTPAPAETRSVTLCGASVPFGTDLLFRCREMPDFCLGVEICEDLWTAVPPSSQLALNGAKVIFNLSASPEAVGKHAYLRQLIAQQSARTIGGYVYCSAGFGESSTDLVFAGNGIIAENGKILREAKRFVLESSHSPGDRSVISMRCRDCMTTSSPLRDRPPRKGNGSPSRIQAGSFRFV